MVVCASLTKRFFYLFDMVALETDVRIMRLLALPPFSLSVVYRSPAGGGLEELLFFPLGKLFIFLVIGMI